MKKLKLRHKAKQQPRENGLFGVERKLPKRGGDDFNIDLVDETEIAFTILTCINDQYSYLIHDKQVARLIFKLIRAKMSTESLVLSPNLMRFIALKLIRPQEAIWKVGAKTLILTENRNRLIVRVLASVAVGLLNVAAGSLFYGILSLLIVLDGSQHCGYNCDRYFEQLPNAPEHVRVYSRQRKGNLVISANEEVEIIVPSTMEEAIEPTSQEVQKRPRSRKKAKRVTLLDIIKHDPVLRAFDHLEEPQVPQTNCEIKESMQSALDFD